MAITNHRIVTGTAGGSLGITNVGSGADVTWTGAVTTYPTLASAGLYYATADGTALINLAASNAARGTYYAWNTQGDDPQPVWATSPGYFELNSGVIGHFVEFIANSALTALTSGQQDGLEITFGLGLAINGAYVSGSNPGNAPTLSTSIINQTIDTGGSGAETNFQMGLTARNSAGFHPGWGVDMALLAVGTETVSYPVGGGTSAIPAMMLSYGDMAKIRIHWDRASSDVATDGTVMIFVNDVLMHKSTGASLYVTAQGYLARLCGIGSGYGTALTGTKIRYCGPIMVRTVPNADLDATLSPPWSINTTRNYDLRRWYAAKFANVSGSTYGAPWTISGTATLPSVGTAYSSTGTIPGRSRFVIAGTSSQTFSIVTNAPVWTGGVTDDPRGEDGRVWYRFTDIYGANNCDITATIVGNSGTLHTVQVKTSTTSLVVDGVTLNASLAASKRFEVFLGIGVGNTCVFLHEVTSDNFAATTLKRYSVSNTWTGASLGTVTIAGTFSGSVSAEVGSFGAYSRFRFYAVDSYMAAEANALTPKLHGLGSRSSSYMGQGQDITVPGGYDPLPYGNDGLVGYSVCALFARSGNRLSQFMTYLAPELTGSPAIHGILYCGVCNDVTQANATYDATYADAVTIADRQIDFIDLVTSTSGTCAIVDAPNIETGSGSGAWTTRAMTVPGIVATLMPELIRQQNYPNGRVRHIQARMIYHANDSVMDADGIHMDTAQWVINMHDAAVRAEGRTGYNADGSVAGQAAALSDKRFRPFIVT